MPNLPPVYIRKESKDDLERLCNETGFPQSHILMLAISVLDGFFDDIEELKQALQTQKTKLVRDYEKRGRKSKRD